MVYRDQRCPVPPSSAFPLWKAERPQCFFFNFPHPSPRYRKREGKAGFFETSVEEDHAEDVKAVPLFPVGSTSVLSSTFGEKKKGKEKKGKERKWKLWSGWKTASLPFHSCY